jgi:hypothetical protein
MNATTSAFEARALSSSRFRIAEFISRYTRLSEPEVRQVFDFL